MTPRGVAAEQQVDQRQLVRAGATGVVDQAALVAGVVQCSRGQPSPCASLQAAVVEHVYVRDDRHEWLVDAARRMWNAMCDDGLAYRDDLQPHTWQWLRAVAAVAASNGVIQSLVSSLWALDRHDEVAAWDRGEDLPYELSNATYPLAAMTGLWLTLDGRVACQATLPTTGRQLLSCGRLGSWPEQTALFDAELAGFVESGR